MKLRDDARVIIAWLGTVSLTLLVVRDAEGIEWAYGCDDWRHDAAPSFGWDSDGDLRQHDGQRFYGVAWWERAGTIEELLSVWGDTAASGVLVAA